MISVSNLSFKYPKQDTNTLNNISFEIEKGQVFGFLGPSGSGKSTTQKLLIGLLKGHQGNAQLFGRDIRNWGSEIYHKIGIGFELPNHYNKLTALENLKLFASLYGIQGKSADDRIEKLLTETGLIDAANQTTDAFSKGMKMRLNFARALLPNPELLFLDEPTSGLDPVNAQIVRKMIQRHQQSGKTIFLTTHNMVDADILCDQLAFIVEGEIKHIGAPDAMKQQYGERLVEVQQRTDSGETIHCQFSMEDLPNNKAFLTQLGKHNVETIHSKEATLEDVFIKVTGASLS